MAINKRLFLNLAGGGLLSLAALIPNANAQETISGEIKDVPYLKTDINYNFNKYVIGKDKISMGYRIGTTIEGFSFNFSGEVNLSSGESSFLNCKELKIDKNISKNAKLHYRVIFDGDLEHTVLFRINF